MAAARTRLDTYGSNAVPARRAARIANTDRQTAGERDGESGSYEDWSKDELESRAAELDIEGRSDMDKDQLIDALRNH